mgnify:CR=1 FL=1
MRGHIKKRSKNSWTIVLSLGHDPQTGKKKYLWHSVKGTKRDAEKVLAELLHQVDTGGFVKPGRLTVATFLERWLLDYVWPLLSPKTAEGYQDIVRRHLIPKLGQIPLTELKPKHIQEFYAKALSSGRLDGKGGLSPNSVLRYHQCLHSALGSADKWGLVARNVADAVDPPRANKHRLNTVDEDGIKSILQAAQSTPYYALFYCALFTGMRRSELLAIRWCDVDLLMGQISVTRSLHYLRNRTVIFRAPKSVKGRRMVALSPSTCIVLRERRGTQEALYTMMGKRLEDSDLVFSQPDGRPLLPDSVTHAWVKLVRKVGFDGVRLHDARHTHASLLLKQGIHPKVVQERLGHASIAITLDTYSHVYPGLQEAAALKFDQLLSKQHMD